MMLELLYRVCFDMGQGKPSKIWGWMESGNTKALENAGRKGGKATDLKRERKEKAEERKEILGKLKREEAMKNVRSTQTADEMEEESN